MQPLANYPQGRRPSLPHRPLAPRSSLPPLHSLRALRSPHYQVHSPRDDGVQRDSPFRVPAPVHQRECGAGSADEGGYSGVFVCVVRRTDGKRRERIRCEDGSSVGEGEGVTEVGVVI